MPLPPKVCPSCGDEYLHQATTCVHCDVPLVLEGEFDRDAPPPEFPPASELECLRTTQPGWAVALAERLRGAGIAHRVEQTTAGESNAYGVFVLSEDLEAARVIDADHVRSEMPDLPEGFDPRDIPDESEASDACPACGVRIDPEAAECPGCGLFIGEP